MEQRGSPRFLESPLVPLPCSRDPGRAPLPCHCSKTVLSPQVRPRRPQQSCNFRGSVTQLQYSLSTLPDSDFPTLARLASGGWQTLSGWDSNPLDSFGEFQVRVHLPPIPTPQASPGATYCLLITTIPAVTKARASQIFTVMGSPRIRTPRSTPVTGKRRGRPCRGGPGAGLCPT